MKSILVSAPLWLVARTVTAYPSVVQRTRTSSRPMSATTPTSPSLELEDAR